MAKFKVGDRVRLVANSDGCVGSWEKDLIGCVGYVDEVSEDPWVNFENGKGDCGGEEYLDSVDASTSTTTVAAGLTDITIGGKRFRLVADRFRLVAED